MSTNQPLTEPIRLARRGRRAEENGKALRGCLTRVLTLFAVWAIEGTALMLLLNILHSEWQQVPAWGFWRCLSVAILLRVLAVTGREINTKAAKS